MNIQENIKKITHKYIDDLIDIFFNEEEDLSTDQGEESEESEEVELDDINIIVGYVPYWKPTENILNKEKYTHLTYAFMDIEDDGTPNLKEIDKLSHFIFNGEIGISVGGWNGRYRTMGILDNPKNRTNFIQKVLDIITERRYDYLSYDLEYPKKELIEPLLRETKEEINKRGLDIKICCAVGGWVGHVKAYENCAKYIDWVEIMAYDDKNILTFISATYDELLKYGFENIVMGNSYDTNGIPDDMETLKWKKAYLKSRNNKNLMVWETTMKWIEDDKEDIEMVDIDNLVWKDKWDNPYREIVKVRGTDIYDGLTTFRGNGKLWIENGIMTLSGNQPRMYINLNIQNVEIEVKYMRVGNDGMGWSGCSLGVRSHPEGHSLSPEKAHTYYFRLKHGGEVDFYREKQHSAGERNVIKNSKYKWESDKWYKVKFRCYNTAKLVKLEGYINDELVLEYEDKDKDMYNARGVVFIRNTSVEQSKYKDFSIRKINHQ